MSTEYTPPPRLIWESVNGALDITTQLCKDLRAEIDQLKEDKELLRATVDIEAELLRRSECEVRDLKKALEVSNTDLVKAGAQNIKLHEEINDLKAEINLIDPTGELRLEYI